MNSPAVAGNVGIEADGVAETWNAIWENAHLLPMEGEKRITIKRTMKLYLLVIAVWLQLHSTQL